MRVSTWERSSIALKSPVLLDPNGLRRHLAIIAQTGAGKSYLAGKLFESLLQQGDHFRL